MSDRGRDHQAEAADRGSAVRDGLTLRTVLKWWLVALLSFWLPLGALVYLLAR